MITFESYAPSGNCLICSLICSVCRQLLIQPHFINTGWISGAVTVTVIDSHTPHFFHSSFWSWSRRSPRVLSQHVAFFCEDHITDTSLDAGRFRCRCLLVHSHQAMVLLGLSFCSPTHSCQVSTLQHTSCKPRPCTSKCFADVFGFRIPDTFSMSPRQCPSTAVTAGNRSWPCVSAHEF